MKKSYLILAATRRPNKSAKIHEYQAIEVLVHDDFAIGRSHGLGTGKWSKNSNIFIIRLSFDFASQVPAKYNIMEDLSYKSNCFDAEQTTPHF